MSRSIQNKNQSRKLRINEDPLHLKNDSRLRVNFGKFQQYLLEDYTFLKDYQLLESSHNTEGEFLARIRHSTQLVKFRKTPFDSMNTKTFQRFENLVELFENGTVLADNMFILQEKEEYYYYIIEPCTDPLLIQQLIRSEFCGGEQQFISLQQYLVDNLAVLNQSFRQRRRMFEQLKILVDNILFLSTESSYCGLNLEKIVIGTDKKMYFLPFDLEPQIHSQNVYQRAYYPPEMIVKLIQLEHTKDANSQTLKGAQLQCSSIDCQKWDIWSLGCITLEIFSFLTPCLLSYSLEEQLQAESSSKGYFIQKMQQSLQKNIQQKSENSVEKGQKDIQEQMNEVKLIRKFVENCLTTKPCQRSMSFELVDNGNVNCIEEVHKRLDICPKVSCVETGTQYLELNNFEFENQSESGSHFFKLQIEELSQIGVSKQLRLQIRFLSNPSQYRFTCFIDPICQQHDSQQSDRNRLKKVPIKRRISFGNKSFCFFEKLLEKQVEVTLVDSIFNTKGTTESKLVMNFGCLTMTADADSIDGSGSKCRVWQKPIESLYKFKHGGFKDSVIKVNCSLFENNQEPSDGLCELSKSTKQQSNQTQSQALSQLGRESHNNSLTTVSSHQRVALGEIDILPNSYVKADTSGKSKTVSIKSKTCLSISEISNQISEISSYWKNKSKDTQLTKSDQTQKQECSPNQLSVSHRLHDLLGL